MAPEEGSSLVPASLEQSSVSGEKLAYAAVRAFADSKSSPYSSQYIASRDAAAGEWRTHSINPPPGRPLIPAVAQLDTELKALSPDLCEAWVRTVSEPPLAAEAVEGTLNLYRRSDNECGGLSYQPLTTVKPLDGKYNPEGLELQGSRQTARWRSTSPTTI